MDCDRPLFLVLMRLVEPWVLLCFPLRGADVLPCLVNTYQWYSYKDDDDYKRVADKVMGKSTCSYTFSLHTLEPLSPYSRLPPSNI